MPGKTYNYTPLANKYRLRQALGHIASRGTMLVKVFLALFILLLFGVFGVGMMLVVGTLVTSAVSAESARAIMSAAWIGVGAVTGLVLWAVIRAMVNSAVESLRLQDFAAANGLQFAENAAPNGQPGSMFQYGHSRFFTKLLTVGGESDVLIGNYQYTTGSGKNRSTHTCGVVRVSLTRKLPHVVLDAKSNNFLGRISNFWGFDDDQKIELEGDFGNYFSVYAPANYGRDMLYWLTPELMEILKQHFAAYDIEVIDNYAYLYSSRTFALNETGVKSLLELSAWLQDEFEQNTRRYSDDRVGSFAANAVAEPGRRLKRKIPWWTFVALAVYIVIRVIASFRS